METEKKKGLSQAQCRTSAITSAKLGVGPSTPTEALPSSNEVANARTAAQPIMALHLRVHADRARPRNKSETPRVLAHAKSLKNCAVSEEKRPPTSPAIATSRPPTSACEFRVRGLLVSYRGACPRSGRLNRAVPTERILARVCREAGAVVRSNVKLRDMNVTVPIEDERAIEVLASGLPMLMEPN